MACAVFAEEQCSLACVEQVRTSVIRKRHHAEGIIRRELHTASCEKKKPKLSPNYFLAVPVCDPTVRAAAKKTQEAIAEKNVLLLPAMIPLETLHITLMVLRLENAEEVERSADSAQSQFPNKYYYYRFHY